MPVTIDERERRRNLHFLSHPLLWPQYPLLPLVRSRPGCGVEYGVMCDLLEVYGIPGYSASVFIANILMLPNKLDDFLALPKEVFDTAEEVFAAGWRVD
jgi:hypothetical protein